MSFGVIFEGRGFRGTYPKVYLETYVLLLYMEIKISLIEFLR
jgi:hypothetical protein